MATFTVTTASDTVDAGDGKLSLREAVSLANAQADADTITFAAALEGKTLALTKGQLDITHDVTIAGDPDGDRVGVTIDQRTDRPPSGDYTYDAVYARVLEVGGDANARLQGLMITGGYTYGDPGSGAGISVSGGHNSLTLQGSVVADNVVKRGSHDGGAGHGYGGGIAASDASVTVIDSAIVGNYAFSGGGIITGGPLTLRNSTVANNSGDGAAIMSFGYASLHVESSTVTSNRSGGIDGCTVHLANSVVLGNGTYGTDVYGVHIISNGQNVLGTLNGPMTADIVGADAAKVFASVDPQTGGAKLVLANGTWVARLRDAADNPAVAFADAATAGADDQRGADRPAPDGTAPDAGAFELSQKAHIPNVPTAGDDRLLGTPAGDVIDALAGNDQIRGLGGNDLLQGSAGRDLLLGGEGNDRLLGGTGDDVLEGGPGRDVLDGGDGSDTAAYTAAAADVTVSLALAGAQATGGAGTDTLVHIENLTGSSFDDRLTGDGAANRIDGGFGSDTIHGGGGNDVLEAGGFFDDDVLFGDAGNDVLHGGLWGSILVGGAGDDRLDGADGYTDTASYVDAGSGVRVDLTVGGPQDTGGAGRDTLVGIENLTGSGHADRLTGDAEANRLDGGDGDDTLRAGDGDDLLTGGAGSDFLYGGAGVDEAHYADAGGAVQVSLQAGRAYGADGKDWLYGIEVVTGGRGDDQIGGDGAANQLFGGDGADSIYGLGGDDTIDGGRGGDVLAGGGGTDDIWGGEGDDTIRGGPGADQMWGSDGHDRFTYDDWQESTSFARDNLNDFEGIGTAAGDRIDLSKVYAGTLDFVGTEPFTHAGQVRIAGGEWDTYVAVNLAGDVTPEMEIAINTLDPKTQWVAEDFIL